MVVVMNTQQPEALRLADELDAYHTRPHHREAAAELRRLHEENKLLHERHSFNNKEFVRLHSVNAELLEIINKLEYSYEGNIKRYPTEAEVNAAIAKAQE
jgi:hypothetical protein